MKRKQIQQNSAKNQKSLPKGKPSNVASNLVPKPAPQPAKQQTPISKSELEPSPMNLEEDDNYDPARPNDYEKILEERRQKDSREYEGNSFPCWHIINVEFEPEPHPMETNSPPQQQAPIPEEVKVEGICCSVISNNLESTEEERYSKFESFSLVRDPKKQKIDAPKGINPAVAKMMAKMGYKEGQGKSLVMFLNRSI